MPNPMGMPLTEFEKETINEQLEEMFLKNQEVYNDVSAVFEKTFKPIVDSKASKEGSLDLEKEQAEKQKPRIASAKAPPPSKKSEYKSKPQKFKIPVPWK